jgi:hypothetical protein
MDINAIFSPFQKNQKKKLFFCFRSLQFTLSSAGHDMQLLPTPFESMKKTV